MQNRNFDLEKRTLEFSKSLIKVLKNIPKNQINLRLIDQCLRSGTAIGANYREANEAVSKKDFRNKIRLAKQEAKETLYWLALLIESNQKFALLVKDLQKLSEENKELMKILGAIYEKSK